MAFQFNPDLAEKPERAAYQLSPSVVRKAEEMAQQSGAKVDQVVDQALRYAFGLDGRPRRKKPASKDEKSGKTTASAG